MSFTVEFLERFEPLRDVWTGLAEASGNIFATWEWNELWWRHYGGERQLRLGVVRADEDVAAIVPLFRWRERPLRVLRLLGHGHGDLLGPIAARNDGDTSVEALRLALTAEPHDVFVGDWVSGDRGWTRHLGGRVLRTTGYPIVDFAGRTWEEFLGAQSSSFRKNTRYYRNRLERQRDVVFRYADRETLGRDLDEVFRLHIMRFDEHEGCLFCGEHEPFQRAFAALALERDWLRLLLLEVEGRAIACEYGFWFQNAYFAYQGGRDPAWERESVGFVLELESIRESFVAGGSEYRFLEGDEGYKYRLPTRDPRLETVAVPANLRGRLAVASLAAARALPVGKVLVRRFGSR